MADQEKVELTISAVLDGGSINDLTKELTSGVEKATTEGGKRAQKQYAEFIAASVSAGVRRAGEDNSVKYFSKRLANAEAMQKAIVQAYENGEKEHAKMLERKRKKEMAHLKRITERRNAALADYAQKQQRSLDQVADDFSEKIGRGVTSALSGDFDLGGIVKGIGKKMQTKGDTAVARGRMADASKLTKVMGRLGQGIAAIGTGVAALGAVAGMIVVLVKAFIDLDQKIKDMNKSIVGTAGAADFGFGTAGQAMVHMSSQLETIRGQILEQAADWEGYRQSSESMFQVLGAMNEMNFTFKRMQEEVDNTSNSIRSFADISIRAVAYGKLLGVTTDQMGQNMAQMANEFGVGLDTISEGLHLVHKEALLSGFSTKRFYSTILEVTSGLGQYNVRLHEAAGLLGDMGAALGEARGGKLFKDIAGDTSFAGKSPVDALKDILIKGGPGKVKDIFADEAAAKAADMFNAMTEEQRKAFGKKFSLDTSSAQAFGEAFAKAAPGQKAVGAAMAELGIRGEARGFGTAAARLGKAGRGDIDRMATTFGDLGGASRMRFMMRMPAMFGRSFKDMTDLLERGKIPELQAFLDAQGMSMEQFKNLAELQGALADEFDAMKKASAGMAEGEIIDRGEFGRFRKEAGGEFVAVDDQGNPIGAAFKDVDSYLDAQNDYIEQQTKVVDEDLELGKQIAKNTEGLNQVIQENVAAILNKIYSTLMDIWHWISGDKAKRQQMQANRRQFKSTIERAKENVGKDIKKAQKAMATAKTPQEKQAAETALEEAQTRSNMLDQVQQVAAEIDPTEYASAGAYANAVYKAAGLSDKDIAFLGGGSGKAGPKLPGGRAKATTAAADVESLMMAAADDWEINPTVEQVWGPVERVFRNQVVRGSSGKVKDQWEDLLAFTAQMYRTELKRAPKDWLGSTDLRGINQWAIGFLNSAVIDPNFQWNDIKGAASVWSAASGLPDPTEATKYSEDRAQGRDFGSTKMGDMYVPSNGRPIRLDTEDSVLAMKPRGAVDRAMGRGGGGGVTIIVKNYGNPREVQEAVVRGIKIARGEPFA
jgi:hypothetical protein